MERVTGAIVDSDGKVVLSDVVADIEFTVARGGFKDWRGWIRQPAIVLMNPGHYIFRADDGRSGEIILSRTGTRGGEFVGAGGAGFVRHEPDD